MTVTTTPEDIHLVGVRLALAGQTLAEARVHAEVAAARAAGARWRQIAELAGYRTPGAARYRFSPGLEDRRARHRANARRRAA